MVARRIATHRKPDADAIAAAWPAGAYLFGGGDVEVVVVPRPLRSDRIVASGHATSTGLNGCPTNAVPVSSAPIPSTPSPLGKIRGTTRRGRHTPFLRHE